MPLSYRLIEVEYENKDNEYIIQWFKKYKSKYFFGLKNNFKGNWCNVFGHTFLNKEEAIKVFNTYYASDRKDIKDIKEQNIKHIFVLEQNIFESDKIFIGDKL